jgi:hypothetical protein
VAAGTPRAVDRAAVTAIEPPYFRLYGDYRSDGPIFYDRDECPWLAIRDEFAAHRERFAGRLTTSYVPDDVAIVGWRAVNFVTYRHWWHRKCRGFPHTVAALRAIPHLTTAFLSLLEPGAELPVHNGDTNTTYRCHLALEVPSEDVERCGLEVGGARRGWREGEAFAFNEAWRHTVWNRTDRPRAVLVFDVLRPEYRDRTRAVCGDVLAAMSVTALETALPPLRHVPVAGRRLLHRALGLGARGVLRVADGVR